LSRSLILLEDEQFVSLSNKNTLALRPRRCRGINAISIVLNICIKDTIAGFSILLEG